MKARLAWVFLTATFLSAADEALALDSEEVTQAPARKARLEITRESVNRGTTEETTKTFLRSDSYLSDGSILSFQVAFPDAKTDFDGSPFDPRLGDIKSRFRFAPFSAAGFGMSTFFEAVLPTADPEELGSGKYQLSAGVTAAKEALQGSHRLRFTAQLQQTNSVAGDEARPNINYTKLDLSLRDIHETHWFKLAVNTRVDWEQDGKTGAVGELELGRNLGADWRAWLMVGGLLWGEGVKGTYGTKVRAGLDYSF